MDEFINVHHYPERGELTLWCGEDDFCRISRLILTDSTIAKALGHQPTNLRTIIIERTTSHRPLSRLKNGVLVIGCGLVAIAMLVVFVAGVFAIFGWME